MANLVVEGLSVHAGSGGPQLLRGVSFSLATGERRALVGRSGAGKSLVAASLIRLLRPPLVVTGGKAILDGTDLLSLDQRRMRAQRGTGIFLLFQSPGSALNPCWDLRTLVTQAAERRNRKDARQQTEQALQEVGLANAADRYPFELSGGMRQRVLIAMALVLQPRLLIADEPTTGLDPQTQSEVLSSMDMLLERTGASLLFITHDLRAAGVLCPEAMVLDSGRIVAQGPWEELRSGEAAACGFLKAARSLEP
jgi:ABC-type glutathione transport system ATPase component